MEKKTDELAHLETISMGMPRSLATRMIGMHVSTFRYYAGLTDKIHGESYMEDGDDGLLKMINYQPMGVCAGISAWNGTPLQAGWKVITLVRVSPKVILLTVVDRPGLGCRKYVRA